MTSTEISPSKPARRGLPPFLVQQLRARLRRSTCSETWIDDQIVTVTDTKPNGKEISISYFDSKVFPPGGRRETKMRWCRLCGRYTPPQAIHLIEHRKSRFGRIIAATLQCDDCRIAIDDEQHKELYQADLHLRPLSSQSFVLLRTLFSDRKHGRS